MLPLNYAILHCYRTLETADADQIMESLKADYERSRSFRKKTVVESLMTAKENGILEEAGYEADAGGGLHVFYRLTDYGKEILDKYIPITV
ncbi:MAG: hypothetical protein LBC58_04265 [Clostridiales Family XIII bacterium]|jgi:hypothetical protein|nr:hypothetical protein [Clostridiales Family XIII bacterium]